MFYYIKTRIENGLILCIFIQNATKLYISNARNSARAEDWDPA